MAGVDGVMPEDDQLQLILFLWLRSPEKVIQWESLGWVLVGRRWQASTDKWSYLMRKDND